MAVFDENEYARKAEQLVSLLQQIPQGADSTRDSAAEIFSELDAAYNAGDMPAWLETKWEQYRSELVQCNSDVNAFIDTWKTDHPVFTSDWMKG